MLFNTPEFIFLFLPFAVLLHFTLSRWSVNAAIAGTTASSLLFYAWWNPPFVLLPILSILGNYSLARRMVAATPEISRRLLIFGIACNVLVLCYYKYADFLLSIFDGRALGTPNVPLALSFTTFVQIAFLVYVHRQRPTLDLGQYGLFVAFFPHLIAGPIVRWGSLGRQLADRSRYRVDWDNGALGVTIFTLGLAKKVLIADSLAPHAAIVFNAAARGEAITAIAAWGGATAFSLQIFFDFSGYSEMAVGLGLLFNYRLPINFAAPLRSADLFDLWRRWHITLMRFLRDFIYVPLAQRNPGPFGRSAVLLFTFVLSGLWHGANWTFVVWGALHGAGLVVVMAWQSWRGPGRAGPLALAIGWFLTFTFFVATIVFFRAPDLATAVHLISAMAGFGGAPIGDISPATEEWIVRVGFLSDGFVRDWFGRTWTVAATLWTLTALGVVLIVPDTMEIVGYREGDAQSNWRRRLGRWEWQPSPTRLAVTVVVFAVTFAYIGRVSEFLYYQF